MIKNINLWRFGQFTLTPPSFLREVDLCPASGVEGMGELFSLPRPDVGDLNPDDGGVLLGNPFNGAAKNKKNMQ